VYDELKQPAASLPALGSGPNWRIV